jgi:hypothetical protein
VGKERVDRDAGDVVLTLRALLDHADGVDHDVWTDPREDAPEPVDIHDVNPRDDPRRVEACRPRERRKRASQRHNGVVAVPGGQPKPMPKHPGAAEDQQAHD